MTGAAAPVGRSSGVSAALLAVLGAFALVHVVKRAWTCDDAFISYRYARHLVEGRGLVWNPGERVEAYTNPLFTLGLAAAMALGAEPRLASMAAGVVAYFAMAYLLSAWSRERTPKARWWIPLGSALWLVQDDLHTWATGGLETTVFAALSLSGIRRIAVPPATAKSVVSGGLWLALACLTRPDGVVFAAVGVLGALAFARSDGVSRQDFSRRAALVMAPLAALGGAFATFKLVYYGRLLPTTFYAKSAASHYYEQGLVYLGLYAEKHWAMTLACVALPIAAVATGGARTLAARRDALLALAAFAAFAAYVAHSGGDYMFARRLVPALPFLFVFLDAAIASLPPKGAVASAVALAGASFFPYRVLPEERPAFVHGITDERLHYPEAVIAARKGQAELARTLFEDAPITASFGGGMCMFAYYSDLPSLVEPNGLTQYWAAERPLARRTEKIGHEKSLSRDDLRDHGVLLIFHRDLPPILDPEPRYNEILVGQTLKIELLVYDAALVDRLRRFPGVRFHPIDQTLSEAAADLRTMSCEDARASLDSLSRFYLDRHPAQSDPIRQSADAACGTARAVAPAGTDAR